MPKGVYLHARSFDYAAARRMRWVDGLPLWFIAEELGVSISSVRYATSAKRRSDLIAHARRQTRSRAAAVG